MLKNKNLSLNHDSCRASLVQFTLSQFITAHYLQSFNSSTVCMTMFLSKPTCISYLYMPKHTQDGIERFAKMHVLSQLPFICLFCNLIRKVKKAIWLDLSYLSLFVLLLMVPLLKLRKIIFFTQPRNAFIICLLFMILISLAFPVIVTKYS